MTGPVLEVRFGAVTHPGLVRAANEDSYLTVPPVFVVADGMGGHANGAAASKAVTDAFLELSTNSWMSSDDLMAAVERATTQVMGLAGEGRAPGSTLSGVGLTEQGGMPCWLVFNIGDSRTHLLRGGELNQISVDHSAAVRAAAEGAVPVARNVITRALGAGLRRAAADQWLIPAAQGDVLMICSDGLTNEVTPELVAATLLASDDPQEAAQSLVQAAIHAGGHDNVTAVVVQCTNVVSTAPHTVVLDDSTASSDDDDTVQDETEEVA